MGQISGAYPGGPRKRDEEEDRSAPRRRPDLSRAEDIEGRLHDRHRAAVRRRRRKRLLAGFLVAIVIAGVAGFWLGTQSNRTSEEIAAEQNGRSGQQGLDITRERNTILQQLWLMEDLERARRR